MIPRSSTVVLSLILCGCGVQGEYLQRSYDPPSRSVVDAYLDGGIVPLPGADDGREGIHYGGFPTQPPSGLREWLEDEGHLPKPRRRRPRTLPDGRTLELPGGARVAIDPDAPPPHDPGTDSAAFRYANERLEDDLRDLPPTPDTQGP